MKRLKFLFAALVILALLTASIVFPGGNFHFSGAISEKAVVAGDTLSTDWLKAEVEAWQHLYQRALKQGLSAQEMRFRKGLTGEKLDFLHYDISAHIFPADGYFDGTTKIVLQSEAEGVTSLALYLDEAQVEYVRLGQTDASFSTTIDTMFGYGELDITLPRPLNTDEVDTLIIKYTATAPQYDRRIGAMITPKVTYFLWNAWYPRRRYEPLVRDRTTAAVHITVPSQQVAVTSGVLKQVSNHPDGSLTYHWEVDFPALSYPLVVAPFDKASRPYHDIYVEEYIFPGDDIYTDTALNLTLDILDFYSSIYLPYPYPKFAVVEIDEAYGGGNAPQSLSCLWEPFFWTSPLGLDRVHILAHEVAHQWWGHVVTFQDIFAGGAWQNEGFAEYSSILYIEHFLGKEAMRDWLERNASRYLDMLFWDDLSGTIDKPIASPEVLETDAYGVIVYCKGSWILHMLRYVLGDSAFLNALSTYAQNYYLGSATVPDFQNVCETVSGRDLDWFFAEWLYDKGAPWYWLEDYYRLEADSTWSAKVKLYEDKPFAMPIDITFYFADHDTTLQVWMDSSPAEHTFHFDTKPDSIKLDRDGWILKRGIIHNFPINSLIVNTFSDSEAVLSWRQNAVGEVGGYNIYRSITPGGAYVRLNTTPVMDTTYQDTTLVPGGTYYWVITAVDKVDTTFESNYSNEKSNAPWIVYDDGRPDSFNRVSSGMMGAVRFTPDTYPVKLMGARFFIYEKPLTYPWGSPYLEVRVWDDDGKDGAPGTLLVDPIELAPDVDHAWFEVDLSQYEIEITSGDFYIGWRDMGRNLKIGNDNSDSTISNRSWFYQMPYWHGYSGFVSMIRAQVLPAGGNFVAETTPFEPPGVFELNQNYPNPFNPMTTIHYQLPRTAVVSLKIYNLLGQEVRILVDKLQRPGSYTAHWDGRDDQGQELPSGVYFYRLRIDRDKFVETKKMLLLR